MFPHMSSKDLQELFGMHNTSSGARDDIGYEDLRKLLCGGAGKRALIPSLGEIFKVGCFSFKMLIIYARRQY